MRDSEVEELDRLVKHSLGAFLHYVREHKWIGRENEAVSLYAFGFLQEECMRGALLSNPTQIGIEVGATNAMNKGPKSQTRKDLVIWRQPAANRWFPPGPPSIPLAIMEWKVRRSGFQSGQSNAGDRAWLVTHCADHPDTMGYAVWLLLNASPAQVLVHRIDYHGERELKC